MEKWKTIESLEHKYAVSSEGRIKNLKTERILKCREFKDSGYRKITISFNKKVHTFQVHRLVLETFNPVNDMGNLDVHHINWCRDDNSLENLMWLPKVDNQNQKIKNTKSYFTFVNLLVDLGDDDLNEILKQIKKGE